MARGEPQTRTQSPHALLIVDDERSLRFSIGEWARDGGYAALEAEGGEQALDVVREQSVDAVLLDLKLGAEDGIEVLKRLRAEDESLPVIMLTGHGTIAHAVEATRLGAFDFMVKPPDLDHLGVVVARAIEHTRLRRELDGLRREKLPTLVGAAGLAATLQQLEKAARSSTATVLLQGETGSGKGLLARWLHARSPRAGAPMVELNCSAIPESLLESELYGHEKGAFTDAKRFRKGLVEMADGGTLFLDEIGEMAPALQAKLLHVLETRTFRRVGGGSDISVDVRIVAATHRDLPRAVAEGRFREDLFFRLNVVPVHVPALRERVEDIEPLAEHFVATFCHELGRRPARLHPAALAALKACRWPGNVRELRNVIERVVLLEADDEIRPEHLPPGLAPGPAPADTSGAMFTPGVVRPLAEVELAAIQHALGVCGGNKTRAAAQLGISRQTLRTKLKEHALEDEEEV
ncbi:MAG TPA: sigma-54 dependent transcriptional regulator [Candidatus Eisenbacteria bacterium]|nr:sigma-54 dependent transcriptional regulator [Candidatus Eisenbacteria bacterium]